MGVDQPDLAIGYACLAYFLNSHLICDVEHEATLTTTFEQSSDSTKVTFALAGVPKGLEDELERNIDGY